MKQLELQDLAGYASKYIAWRCLGDVSKQLLEGNNTMPEVDNIVVENDEFVLQTTTDNSAFSESDAVWHLGSSVFFLLMGSTLSSEMQRKNDVIPMVNPVLYGKELSQLLALMLSPDANERPSLSHIKKLAEKECETAVAATTKRITHNDVRDEFSFWPEAMRRAVVILLLLVMVAGGLMAQSKSSMKPNAELSHLISLVKKLRQSTRNKSVSNDVLNALEKDTLWTLMDELKTDVKNECSAMETKRLPMFCLNDMCRIAYRNRSKEHLNSGKLFHRGDDPNFRYSMIEITVRKGGTVTYDISGREGEQLLAIVPYETDAKLKAEVLQISGVSTSNDGEIQYIKISRDLKRQDHFTLKVKNLSNKAVAFVVFNYNSQNK